MNEDIDSDVVESTAMTLDILDNVTIERARELAGVLGAQGAECARQQASTHEEEAWVAMLVVLAPRYPLSPVALVNAAVAAMGD